MTEQHLTRAIIEAVNAARLAIVWRNQSGRVKVRGGWMTLAPEGAPDVIGFTREGRFVGIEAKLPKEQPTEIQEQWLAEIASAGGIAGVARSIEDAIAILRGDDQR